MANEPRKSPFANVGHPGQMQPDTQVGDAAGRTFEPGRMDQEGHRSLEQEDELGIEVQQDRDGVHIRREDQDGSTTVTGEEGTPPGEAGTVPGAAEEGTPAAAAAEYVQLPTFDPAKADVVEDYNKRFLNDDGSFNETNLTQDWQANAKFDKNGKLEQSGLTPSTLAYLGTKGITPAMAAQVEQGQLALVQQHYAHITTLAGGKENYDKAIAWARANKYDSARFNAALAKGGQDADDAVTLLMTRFKAATPKGRGVVPARTVGANAGAQGGPSGGDNGGVQPYANYAEYQKDFRAAQREGDQQKLALNRARLKASPFYGKK